MIGVQVLERATATLQELAGQDDRALAADLLERSRTPRLRVLVAGEAKRGKSTLVNQLVGADVLPTGVVPVTALPTTVRLDEPPEGVTVTYLDGRVEGRNLRDLEELVSERFNPQNTKGVKDLLVRLAATGLPGERLDLIDTPGIGSVYEQNTVAARQAYESLDCVIVVLSASPPINTAERALLKELSNVAVATFVVLNKTDQLSPSEVQETIDFTERVCAEIAVDATVWPMSARDADDGFEAFRVELSGYLKAKGQQDAVLALAGHALRLARRMRDETRIRARAEELHRAGQQGAIGAFREQVQGLARSAGDTDDNCQVAGRRILRDLEHSAAQERGRLTARCRAALGEWAASPRERLSVADVADSARPIVVDLISRAVRDWHSRSAVAVVAGLEDLAARCRADQSAAGAALRAAGLAILGVEISADYEPVTLRSDRAFWLDFSPPASWEAPFASTVRHHLPGAAQRAVDDLRAEIAVLVDRQIGRARSDLQMSLQESVRQLSRDLQRGQRDTLDRLGRALTESLEQQRAGAEDAESLAFALSVRSQALDGVIAELTAHLDPAPLGQEDR